MSACPTVTFDFQSATLSPPPVDMGEFVRQLNRDEYRGSQKRREPRFAVVLEAPTVELDKNFRPIGQAFIAITRDVSSRGICLIHTRAVQAPYLLVKLDDGKKMRTELIVRILRRRQMKKFFELAGAFVTRGDSTAGESAAE